MSETNRPDAAASSAKDLMDIHQVKQRLNCSERSVRTLVALGHLPRVDMTPLKKVRFDPRDVDAFIESRRPKPRSAQGASATTTTHAGRRAS